MSTAKAERYARQARNCDTVEDVGDYMKRAVDELGPNERTFDGVSRRAPDQKRGLLLHMYGDMGIFQRKVPSNYIPIHPDNVRKKDWVILLEAGTVIGPSADKLRVVKATLEKRIVRKYNIFLRKQYFLVLDDYDPQIHAVYFCPQLYKPDSEGNLIPLEGEEIGQLIAQSLREGVVEKQPWYDPASKLQRPIIPTDRSI